MIWLWANAIRLKLVTTINWSRGWWSPIKIHHFQKHWRWLSGWPTVRPGEGIPPIVGTLSALWKTTFYWVVTYTLVVFQRQTVISIMRMIPLLDHHFQKHYQWLSSPQSGPAKGYPQSLLLCLWAIMYMIVQTGAEKLTPFSASLRGALWSWFVKVPSA